MLGETIDIALKLESKIFASNNAGDESEYKRTMRRLTQLQKDLGLSKTDGDIYSSHSDLIILLTILDGCKLPNDNNWLFNLATKHSVQSDGGAVPTDTVSFLQHCLQLFYTDQSFREKVERKLGISIPQDQLGNLKDFKVTHLRQVWLGEMSDRELITVAKELSNLTGKQQQLLQVFWLINDTDARTDNEAIREKGFPDNLCNFVKAVEFLNELSDIKDSQAAEKYIQTFYIGLLTRAIGEQIEVEPTAAKLIWMWYAFDSALKPFREPDWGCCSCLLKPLGYPAAELEQYTTDRNSLHKSVTEMLGNRDCLKAFGAINAQMKSVKFTYLPKLMNIVKEVGKARGDELEKQVAFIVCLLDKLVSDWGLEPPLYSLVHLATKENISILMAEYENNPSLDKIEILQKPPGKGIEVRNTKNVQFNEHLELM